MKLTFKNILHTTHAVASEEMCPTGSDDYEKKIESMAEDLVIRTPRLHKRLGALRLSGLSKKERQRYEHGQIRKTMNCFISRRRSGSGNAPISKPSRHMI